MKRTTLTGVVILDKPHGLPSNRVLGQVKKILDVGRRGQEKIGFLGTLDPLATGVLPLFVGKATKLIHAFEGLEKTYRATIRLGQRTTTLDAEGEVVSETDWSHLHPDEVEIAILEFQGKMEQQVPAYSAVKIDGVPAYRLARKGHDVPDRVRTVNMRDLVVEEIALPRVTFRVTVSAGTYIRSLAEDIGQRLHVGAHLIDLRRLACGDLFTLEKSITLEELELAVKRADFSDVRNAAQYLVDYLPLIVEDATEQALREGRTIPLRLLPGFQKQGFATKEAGVIGEAKAETRAKALRPCGTLVAVGDVVQISPDDLGFQPSKVLI